MSPLFAVAAGILVALAVPYHLPRLGVVGGLLGMALAITMIVHQPAAADRVAGTRDGLALVQLDFGLSRPIGLALALVAMLWLVIAAARLVGAHEAA